METSESEIGYILKGYPRTSETFIANEIWLLEQAGQPLTIFSLKRLEGEKRHGVVGKIRAPVIYLPEPTSSGDGSLPAWLWKNVPAFAASHWRLFRLRPAAYLAALGAALAMSFRYRVGTGRAPNRAFVKEFLQAGFIAWRSLESGRIRHLHAHFCHTSATVAMLASRLSGLPFSFTAHAKDIYRQDQNPGDLLSVKMRRAKFAVTCTRANEIYLDRLRPATTPLHTIYHGLDLSFFIPAAKPGSGISDPAAPPLILSIGRLVEKKGFTYLIEACGRLKEQGYRFECRIIGGGGGHYQEVISGLIERLKLQEVVTLHPAVTQEELQEIYQQATVFALPCQVVDDGDRDGIPNVLVEAMAMELPVVSTRISGIPELIEHRVNGLLAPQKDAPALAAAIAELLDDSDLRRRLGRTARTTVCRDFDSSRNIRELRALFGT
ncbi:MAG TPA: glycosyltransferase family 4 protein [Blastocatellia bacterium]|nr:glycosyltransferase family 4 protein [Blastocatellia bacterium]